MALRAVGADELPDAREALRAGYAAGMVAHAGLPAEVAEAKAERDFAGLFPDGQPAALLDVLVVEEDGARCGYAMLGERTTEAGRGARSEERRVGKECRSRGSACHEKEVLEESARARGLPRVELNVFGGNAVARRLYGSLGYEEIAVYMGKVL